MKLSLDCDRGNTHLFLQHVKIVYDHSDKKIEREEWTADDKDDEIKIGVQIRFSLRLQIYPSRVYSILHHLHPSFESRHLKQSQVSDANVIESDLAVLPRVVFAETLLLGIHYLETKWSHRQ